MFTSKEGQTIPQVTFPTRQGDAWVNVTSDELFKGKTVIVFSLPVPLLQPVHPLTYRATTSCFLSLKSMVSTAFCAYRSTILS